MPLSSELIGINREYEVGMDAEFELKLSQEQIREFPTSLIMKLPKQLIWFPSASLDPLISAYVAERTILLEGISNNPGGTYMLLPGENICDGGTSNVSLANCQAVARKQMPHRTMTSISTGFLAQRPPGCSIEKISTDAYKLIINRDSTSTNGGSYELICQETITYIIYIYK